MDERIAAVVTGGGRGIGRAVARRLSRDMPVVIVGRTAGDLGSAAREIGEGRCRTVVGDVRDPATAARAAAAALSAGWAPLHLVCNAGIGKNGPTETFDRERWKEIFDVNVHGSFHFVQACLPSMLAANAGTISLMSSIAGVKGYPCAAAYVASKHALVGLAKTLGLEYGKRGIVSVAVCPGFVEGEMTERTIRSVMERRGISEAEARQRVARANPQRRILPPEEVAEAVALVCSGKIPSLNGSPLILGGGE